MIHSLPVAPAPDPCETLVRRPHPRLRGHVVAYSGFRTGTPIPHRVLPCNLPVLIIDVTGGARVVTGASGDPAVLADTRWGHGVTVALTPTGVAALLGLPMRELTGATVPLGPGVATLAARLAGIPSWPGRFALLEQWLTTRLTPSRPENELVTEAWWRLQRPGAPRVGTIAADLGVSRRGLETGFQRHIGLPPGRVARIARFQRAVTMVTLGAALPRIAVDAGYADQAHFSREVRSLAGLTPTQLRRAIRGAFVQDGAPARP